MQNLKQELENLERQEQYLRHQRMLLQKRHLEAQLQQLNSELSQFKPDIAAVLAAQRQRIAELEEQTRVKRMTAQKVSSADRRKIRAQGMRPSSATNSAPTPCSTQHYRTRRISNKLMIDILVDGCVPKGHGWRPLPEMGKPFMHNGSAITPADNSVVNYVTEDVGEHCPAREWPTQQSVAMPEIPEQTLESALHKEVMSAPPIVDSEQDRLAKFMFGELTAEDTARLENDDFLMEKYLNGQFTPDSYHGVEKIADEEFDQDKDTRDAYIQQQMRDHMRRRQRGSRWRPQDSPDDPSEITKLAAAQQHLTEKMAQKKSKRNVDDGAQTPTHNVEVSHDNQSVTVDGFEFDIDEIINQAAHSRGNGDHLIYNHFKAW